jgi:hypothetical protein
MHVFKNQSSIMMGEKHPELKDRYRVCANRSARMKTFRVSVEHVQSIENKALDALSFVEDQLQGSAFLIGETYTLADVIRTMPDFWPDEWVRSLKEIEKMDIDYVISGHGPQNQPAIDPASIVTEQREYLEDLMVAVKTAMDSGSHSPDALRKSVKLPKYQDWRFYDQWLPMNIARIWAYYHMGW